MNRPGAVLLSLLLLSPLALPARPLSGPTKVQGQSPDLNKVELNGHSFTLPPGFAIELVAGPDLVKRPIAAAFDEQGRLYVTEVSGTGENVQVQLKKKPHRVLRLEDTRGLGKFDKSTVFADKMTFPEGILWQAGSVYVAAPPSIWKLTDTDGDGVADQRVEWFQGKTLTGCANDLHGPYPGPDGWIYWCKGAFAPQTYERPGRPPFVTRASHIFRCRPDGTGLEPVMTGGMDNPVDVVFTPGGERIFNCTFLQFPAGGKRDGLLHAVYGGIYGKDWEVLHNHPWTGPAVMPVLAHLGAAAPSGLTRYESDAFGPEYRDNLFATLFNMQKVTRHVLTRDGATFQCRTEDFVVSGNKDFHPTDVIEDADGSLLIVDTGGWYKLCCPTSQLVKPDVLGGIYRVRRLGMPRKNDPRGLKLDWATKNPADLARLLGDERPVVRRRAIEALAARGAAALPALEEVLARGQTVEARRNAVWAATRMDLPEAQAVPRWALQDADPTVRQVALHAISLKKDAGSSVMLVKMLGTTSAHNRRAAAEALGRIGDKTAVPALLEACHETGDRVLEHSLTYALIEIADPQGTAAGLQSAKANIRRAALTALDQMGPGKLPAEAVLQELTTADAKLKETAWWIASRHPDWGTPLAGFLRKQLGSGKLTAGEREELVGVLAKLARSPSIQDLLASQVRDDKAAPAARRMALQAMARSGLKEVPPAWIAAVTFSLNMPHGDQEFESVKTARALHWPRQGTEKLSAALLSLAEQPRLLPQMRLTALAALPGSLGPFPEPLFAFLVEQLPADQPVFSRTLAADVLARARLTQAQLLALADSLKRAGPMEVDRLLEAFQQTGDAQVGRRLVAALKASPAHSGLRPGRLRSCLAKFPAEVRKQAEGLYTALETNTAQQRARLEKLLAGLKEGDVRRGQLVFNNPKVACFSCHAIGYLGGKVGPDLTHIGRIRTERDLLEAILFPSASIVRGYEPVVVTTKSGRVVNGVIQSDGPDGLVLVEGPDREVRVSRDDVDEIQPSPVSIMPAGLDQQLTPGELADLVAFLKACK